MSLYFLSNIFSTGCGNLPVQLDPINIYNILDPPIQLLAKQSIGIELHPIDNPKYKVFYESEDYLAA